MAMEEAVEVQHVSHEHPLMLIKPEETEDVWDLTCYGCQQPISVSSSSSSNYYGCKRCMFLLHKTCAQAPHQMTHPSHPLHPLTFFTDGTWNYYRATTICDVCEERCSRFTYHCSLCEYDIDMKCALMGLSIQRSIDHTSHPHKLIPLQKESMFSCDACGEEHKGASFLCTTCGLWINQKCASSPLNLKLNNDHHHHTLSLIYFIPKQYEYCRICSKELWRRSWAYSCSECSYVVHLQCAVSNKEHSTNNIRETKELDPSNSVTAPSDKDPINSRELDPTVTYLPIPDDSVDIITQFIKNTRTQGKYKEAAQIEHICHPHPLTYFDFEKPIDQAASCSMSNSSSLLSGERNAGKCDGCAQSISAPFYRCVECNFSLHVGCAELPHELQHPSHPKHTLSLTMANKYYLECDHCNLFQNIMHYVCSECCFFLDCKCAFLPRVIKHEEHKHNLALRPTSNSKCISCGVPSSVSYECGSCKHYLCARCALLPRNVRHRYDKLHPFVLNYSRLPYQIDDDFCEICEEGIDSNIWFYHCGECNQYLHKDCVFPPSSRKPYTSYGDTVSSPRHQHPLVVVELLEDLLCSLCERNVHGDDRSGLLCRLCKFYICYDCW